MFHALPKETIWNVETQKKEGVFFFTKLNSAPKMLMTNVTQFKLLA
jgi:hypothetical protein